VRLLLEVQAEFGLYEGACVSPDQLSAAQERSDALACERKALELLSRSAHTTRGLGRKLESRGFDSATVQQALRRLEELGYLSDRDFAVGWIQQRVARHPEGRRSLVAGLRRRGVERMLAEEVVQEHVSAETERAMARQEIAKQLDSLPVAADGTIPPPTRAKLYRRLHGRGYDSQLVSSLLRDLEQDLGGDLEIDV
jgi:regulatory protein